MKGHQHGQGWSACTVWRSQGQGLVQLRAETSLGGPHSSSQHLRRGQPKDSARIFTAICGRNMGDKGQKLKQEVPAGYKETIHHEDSQALDQAAQQGCAVSVLGGFQDPTGQSLEQPGLTPEEAFPAWSMGLQRSLPAQVVQT